MTQPKITPVQAHDTNLWWVPGLPEISSATRYGYTVVGYPEEVARRLAAAWNASLPYSVEELEAGAIQAEHDALEYACEKIRLLEIVATGCEDHPGYRGKQVPITQIYCSCCQKVYKAAISLRMMSTKTPSEDVRAAERVLASLGTTAEETAKAFTKFRQSVAALVEEKPAKGVRSGG